MDGSHPQEIPCRRSSTGASILTGDLLSPGPPGQGVYWWVFLLGRALEGRSNLEWWEAFRGLPPWETEPIMPSVVPSTMPRREGREFHPSFSHCAAYFLLSLIGSLGWWWGSSNLLSAMVGREGSVQPSVISVDLRTTWYWEKFGFAGPSSGFLIHYTQSKSRNLYLVHSTHLLSKTRVRFYLPNGRSPAEYTQI